MLGLLLSSVLLSAASRAALPAAASLAPAPPVVPFVSLGYPPALDKARVQSLLQSFVDVGYGRSFRHLGDPRDFDHGHLLLDARTGAPVAILYHTQELAYEETAPGFGYLDPRGRNWLQWLDGRGVRNARRYERASYPKSAEWEWFVARDLPALRARHTILAKMLDPARLGFTPSPSRQWTFARAPCAASDSPASNVIRVSLPHGAPVCLALGAML